MQKGFVMQSIKPSWKDRTVYFALLSGSAVTLAIARHLTPATQGFGTHRQLGLPACTFLQWTGVPCPNCGMTTCFAHAAHLDFGSAFVTQPFGLVLFLLAIALLPASTWLLYRQVPVAKVVASNFVRKAAFIWLGLWLLGWIYKLLLMA